MGLSQNPWSQSHLLSGPIINPLANLNHPTIQEYPKYDSQENRVYDPHKS